MPWALSPWPQQASRALPRSWFREGLSFTTLVGDEGGLPVVISRSSGSGSARANSEYRMSYVATREPRLELIYASYLPVPFINA
jgi:hypothetical protein